MDTWHRLLKARTEYITALQAHTVEIGGSWPTMVTAMGAVNEPTTTGRRLRGRGMTRRVLTFLSKNPRQPVNATAIATGLGMPKKVPTVQATLARLVHEKRVKKLGPGRYQPIVTGQANGHEQRAS